MNYHLLEPEVIVGLGDNTEMDVKQHPPLIYQLHIELEDWLGDDLVETFPCYIVTERLAQGLQNSDMSGFEIKNLDVTLGEYFWTNYQLTETPPKFYWLKIKGKANITDFGLSEKLKLVVSNQALRYIQNNFIIKYARIDNPDDFQDLFSGL